MPHLVLLGDSIFDNESYVSKGHSVTDHLRRELPDSWHVTLLAVDGDVTADVSRQLTKLPSDATHLLLSCGGNDAIRHIPLLEEPVETVDDAFELFSEIRAAFKTQYEAVLSQLMKSSKAVSVCTVYDTVPDIVDSALSALALFNELIHRSAVRFRVPILDLRVVFSERTDYSAVSPIEPSATGGEKLAKAISRMYSAHDFGIRQCVVYS